MMVRHAPLRSARRTIGQAPCAGDDVHLAALRFAQADIIAQTPYRGLQDEKIFGFAEFSHPSTPTRRRALGRSVP